MPSLILNVEYSQMMLKQKDFFVLYMNMIFLVFFFFFWKVLVVLYSILNNTPQAKQNLHVFNIHNSKRTGMRNMSHNNCLLYMTEKLNSDKTAKKILLSFKLLIKSIKIYEF